MKEPKNDASVKADVERYRENYLSEQEGIYLSKTGFASENSIAAA